MKNYQQNNFSFNFGHLLIPGRDIFPISDLEIPNLEWHQELVEKNHFAVQQDFARIKGKQFILCSSQLFSKHNFLKEIH